MVVKDESYYFNTVTIQVEDTLFRVPRKDFEEQSDLFKDMFSMPTGESSEADGQSDEKPLRLERIAADDFRTFLKAFYPKFTVLNTPLTEKELETALVLANMWCFDKLRAVLIDCLDSLHLPPARKLELARVYDIRRWYRKGLESLARRREPLTLDEMKQIGMDLSYMVFNLRDKRLQAILNNNMQVTTGFHSRPITGSEIENCAESSFKLLMDKALHDFSRLNHWND